MDLIHEVFEKYFGDFNHSQDVGRDFKGNLSPDNEPEDNSNEQPKLLETSGSEICENCGHSFKFHYDGWLCIHNYAIGKDICKCKKFKSKGVGK